MTRGRACQASRVPGFDETPDKTPTRAPRAGAASRPRRAARGLFSGLFCIGIGCGDPGAEAPLPEPSPGYPETTSRLKLSLGGDYWKLCHATLVDARWALTAAHCFSQVDPEARGALSEFERSLSVRDAVFHPEALPDGATRLETLRETPEFVAAHDLALVPFFPPLDDVRPVSRWLPSEACSLEPSEPLEQSLGVRGRFGRLGPNDEAQTAQATLLGSVHAEALLGSGHRGILLSARGPSVGPGDSGSGVTSDRSALGAVANGCAATGGDAPGEGSAGVLMGVIQDANPEDPTLPFGLVPLYAFDHARWLATVIETAPTPGAPEPPSL